MKKISFLILLSFACATLLNAQKKLTSKKLNWGAKIGVNSSNLRMENGEDSKWKQGLAAGFFFQFNVTKNWQIQPEVLYSSMGGEVNDANGNGNIRLNYFSLPVLAKYNWKTKLAFIAGPQIDMLIQAKRKSSNSQLTKVTNSYNESSFNVTGGLEYWPWHCLGISTRYIYGLSKVNTSGTSEIKNQGVQFTAAVKF